MAGISVTMLGTGAWLGDPKYKRFGPSVLLEIGGKKILIDAPGGVNYQLARAGVDPNGLDFVFLTHHHADHSSGLVQLIGEMHITKRKAPLTMVSADCGRFFKAVVRPYQKLFDSLREFSDFPIRLLEIGNGETVQGQGNARVSGFGSRVSGTRNPGLQTQDSGQYRVRGLGLKARVFARKLEHSRNYADYGFRFEANGKAVAVTGDTSYCNALVKLVSGADLAVCECSHVLKIPAHMTAYELKTLSLFAKKLVPYHMYPGWDAKKEFKEFQNIHVAKDLEKIKI